MDAKVKMQTEKNKKILIISPQTKNLINFRGDLILDIRKKGHEVVAVVPEKSHEEFFKNNNVKLRLVNLNKNSLSVAGAMEYYKNLQEIIKDEKPDVVFSYTIKPVIFGSLAAKKAGVKEIYSLICGLGMLFSSNSLEIRALRFVGGRMYKKALKCNKKVIFQNRDDIKEFVKRKYVKSEQCELVNGSGVNLERFSRSALPTDNVSFLMVSRVLKEKGVLEYFEAAKIVKSKYPEVLFSYVGAIDKNRNAIELDLLKPYIKSGVINYVPETTEVEKYVALASVFVLPSYYREGIPRTLLEATAMGRPIITTNMPGCRETVIDGKNGLFVKPRDAQDLAEKMIWMIEHKDDLQKMGDLSFEICKEKFAIDKVDAQMMGVMGL